MDKPSKATLETFDRVFPRSDPRAVRRPMFGMDAGVVDDKLFAGVFGEGGITPLGRRWKGYAIADAATWSGRPEKAGAKRTKGAT